jgi:predicted transcriptional regulator
MAATTVLSIRVNDHDAESLERLAEVTGSSKSSLAAEAIRAYVEMNEWQIEVIKKRLDMADRSEYASRERVKSVFEKWGVSEG